MAFDPLQPDASQGWLSQYFNPMRRQGPLAGGPTAPGTADYFAGVDQQQQALAAQQPAQLQAPQQPMSQTTQAPQQLPYMGPGGMDDFGPGAPPVGGTPQPPAPPPTPTAPSAPMPTLDDLGRPVDSIPTAATRAAQRYALPPAPAQLPYSGPSDPAAAAAADYTPARGAYRAGGQLTKEQLDAQYALTVPGESGGNPNAVNKITGAAGTTQFTKGTLQGFLDSPAGKGLTVEDYKNNEAVQRKAFDWLTQSNANTISAQTGQDATPAALIAAHTLGAGGASSLMRKPEENAIAAYGADHGGDGKATTALITNNPAWGIKAGDTSAQALTKIGSYYQTAAAKQGATPTSQVADATPASSTTAPAPATPDATPVSDVQGGTKAPAQLPGYGPEAVGPTDNPAFRPLTMSDRMMKAGGAIMQGRNLTDGLGAGLQSFVDSGRQDQLDQFKIRQEAANTALLGQRLGLVGAQTAAIPTKLDQGQQGLDIRGQQAASTAEIARARLQVQGDRVKLGQDNLAATLNGSRQYGQAVGKDNEATQVAINNDTQSAGEDLQGIGDLRKLVEAEPNVVGGTTQAKVARFFADKFGVDFGVNPTANSIADKLVAASQNSGGLSGAKGIGGRITQQEFAQFSKGVANSNTQPEAYKALLDTYQGIAQRRLDVSQRLADLRKDPAAFQEALNPANGGLSAWRQQQIGGQLAARGITSTSAPPSQYGKDQAGKWGHVDPNSGLGFTVH